MASRVAVPPPCRAWRGVCRTRKSAASGASGFNSRWTPLASPRREAGDFRGQVHAPSRCGASDGPCAGSSGGSGVASSVPGFEGRFTAARPGSPFWSARTVFTIGGATQKAVGRRLWHLMSASYPASRSAGGSASKLADRGGYSRASETDGSAVARSSPDFLRRPVSPTRTVRTGTSEDRTTRSATLPRMRRLSPPRP